jgi:hypothetical protein
MASKMFYAGTLQEGIAEAMQANKAVACFVTGKWQNFSISALAQWHVKRLLTYVTDEREESQRWEDEFLNDDAVKSTQSLSRPAQFHIDSIPRLRKLFRGILSCFVSRLAPKMPAF